ncbi:MAG: hypothetical protein BMS9Abin36_0975 [Gammaproteobacteria bacterium]|nr:MAG: hypothetical protein BMS9Abin36_0975 [Gammaproteobacteria bacterium]
MRILVVDDIPQNLYLLRVLLASKGYEVFEASNGQEALAVASEAPPDIIVSDILMPEMDGFTLCQRWKSDDNLKQIPFIFYTATYTEPQDQDFALKLGADHFLTRPMKGSDFLREVAAVVETRDSAYAPIPLEVEAELEEDSYKQYSERLVRKLEDKLQEFEKKNRRSLEDEQMLKSMNRMLEQRVKERTQELEVTNHELEGFAYSVSHDLRAPLRSMDGFSKALLEDYNDMLDEAGKDYLARIIAASQHMDNLIDDLLILSRVASAEINRQELDLVEMAKDEVSLLVQAQPERKVEFISSEVPVLNGDPALFVIVLNNLLGNAWKFTSKVAQARVELGWDKGGNGGAYFVRDNGAGFDMQYVGKVFDAFQRLHKAEEFSGTGMGLATVQRIIHRHGGRVWAEAEVDRGATFYFTVSSSVDDL